MTGIKKLDRYILQKFLLVFVGAFFICLFVFMMQFTWRYVDELIGKGLSMEMLAQFFWYMGITMVPQALPLAILLASLITFGNLGESLELLSMKAAGVSLLRVMAPLACLSVLFTGVSFYFQNKTSPEAQINLHTLLFSMKQQSPALEIPEGVFYNGVPNINLFVQEKNAETGMLYQTIIYKTDQGFEKAQIVLADSARLEMTSDKLHLKLDLWDGEQFQSLQTGYGSGMPSGSRNSQPYDRETFRYKQLLIDFDSNFNLMDKELLSGMPQAKNMRQIEYSVDSVEHELDSIGRQYYSETAIADSRRPKLAPQESVHIAKVFERNRPAETDFDKLVEQMPAEKLMKARQISQSAFQTMKSDLEWKSMVTSEGDWYIRRHWVEWHQKMTLSLACIIFFFVGAPLGAIIRKGGLGLPTVVSVIIFIFWYIINTSSMKMARDGSINMVAGMWVSTVIIAPFGAFITYKANLDSVVFNIDAYKLLLFRILGIRTKRHLFRKEVIIDEPRMEEVPGMISRLRESCVAYNARKQLLKLPGYFTTFFRYAPDHEVEAINGQMESLIEELSNTRDSRVLGVVNEFPVIYTTAHTSPFHSSRYNRIAGVIVPVGLVLWIRIWRFRLRLYRDMRIIVRTCDRLSVAIQGQGGEMGESGHDSEEKAGSIRRKRRMRVVKWIVVLLVAALFGNVVWNGWKHRRRKKAYERVELRQAPSATPVQASKPAAPVMENPAAGRTLELPAGTNGLKKSR